MMLYACMDSRLSEWLYICMDRANLFVYGPKLRYYVDRDCFNWVCAFIDGDCSLAGSVPVWTETVR